MLWYGTGGQANQDARASAWDGNDWAILPQTGLKYLWFNNLRMNLLMKDPQNNIFCGLGDQHGVGTARLWKYLIGGGDAQVGSNIPGQAMIYCGTWFGADQYIGTMSEDVPGAARLKKIVNNGFVDDFAPGINGVPSIYSYCGIYETKVHDNALFIGTMSRAGEGHVWRKNPTTGIWQNLGAPFSCEDVLSMITFRGKFICTFTTNGAQHPIHYYDFTANAWVPYGVMPAEWTGAKIFNHTAEFKDRLYVTSGGALGKLGLWAVDDDITLWEKVAGNGVPNTFTAPLNPNGASEWGYKLDVAFDKLHMATAGDLPGSVAVFEISQQ